MCSLNGMEDYVITHQTFSKSYAMPGWRVGYAVGPETLIKPMTRLKLYTSICAPTFAQIAAEKALNGPQKCVTDMRKSYNQRRKYVIQRLKEIPGFNVTEPKGAFYAFPSIHFTKNNKKFTSLEFSEWLLKEAKVLVVPGSEFGRQGEGFVRMSLATSLTLLKKAMNRIEKATKKLDTTK
jgi:aspartate/methionine/tyrosine aminotransferase